MAQLLALFQGVWGAGLKTAQRWVAAGCRSLDDVARRTDLSEQTRVGAAAALLRGAGWQARTGPARRLQFRPASSMRSPTHPPTPAPFPQAYLRHAADLQLRIPRAQVAGVEALVRRCVFELVEARGGRRDVERTFCWALGGYRCAGLPGCSRCRGWQRGGLRRRASPGGLQPPAHRAMHGLPVPHASLLPAPPLPLAPVRIRVRAHSVSTRAGAGARTRMMSTS